MQPSIQDLCQAQQSRLLSSGVKPEAQLQKVGVYAVRQLVESHLGELLVKWASPGNSPDP